MPNFCNRLALALGFATCAMGQYRAVPGLVPATSLAPAAMATPVRGATQVNAKDGLTYVWVPAGVFTMGCFPADYVNCRDDESPAHTVTITHGFWMGQTLVPQAAFQRLMGKNPSHYRLASDRPYGYDNYLYHPADPNPGSFNADVLPVDSVTWVDAKRYCRAAGMRLPTEAEWEFAARSGNSSHTPPAKDALGHFNPRMRTSEVRFHRPDDLGIYDMMNNGSEWVEDRYGRYRPEPVTDPKGPAASVGDSRVLRGEMTVGSSYNNRYSERATLLPDLANIDVVLRCAGN